MEHLPSHTRRPASPAPEPPGDARFTIMLSASGRRVALLRLLRQSVIDLGLTPRILATDITRKSAAMHAGDVARVVRPYRDPGCLDELVGLCREFRVRLLVPTIDTELPFYAEHRERFAAVGTYVMVSSPQAIRISNDKHSTHQWLVEQGFPCVAQMDARRLLDEQPCDWAFPLFLKPNAGSASIGARVVRTREELRVAIGDRADFIVQQIAPGEEYTVDVFLDSNGKCRCAVPRLRIETRGGEVTKAVTARIPAVQDLARRVAEALPEPRGILNIQIFYDHPSGRLNVNEINARFGGGYPLAHHAGAPMARWLIEELAGLPCTARDDAWVNGHAMLRYDDAVFLDAAAADIAVIPAAAAHKDAPAP